MFHKLSFSVNRFSFCSSSAHQKRTDTEDKDKWSFKLNSLNEGEIHTIKKDKRYRKGYDYTKIRITESLGAVPHVSVIPKTSCFFNKAASLSNNATVVVLIHWKPPCCISAASTISRLRWSVVKQYHTCLNVRFILGHSPQWAGRLPSFFSLRYSDVRVTCSWHTVPSVLRIPFHMPTERGIEPLCHIMRTCFGAWSYSQYFLFVHDMCLWKA